MDLSDEQMGSVMFGRGPNSWEPVALPAGPRPVPCWAAGLHVDFVDAYSNAPQFVIKSRIDARSWDGKRFTRKGRLFLAVSPDGRAEAYYHDSALRPTMIRRFRDEAGTLHQYRPSKPRSAPTDLSIPVEGEWVEVERLATTQQEGFGGAHIDIVMDDGTPVTLRGPWHGGAPDGFVEAAYADVSDPYFTSRGPRPWHDRVCRAGLFIAEATFIDIFAKYAPHLRLARVTSGLGTRVQPLKPEWSEPKAWVMARDRLARLTQRFLELPEAERPASILCGWWQRCAGKTACVSIQKNKCEILLPVPHPSPDPSNGLPPNPNEGQPK